MTDRDLDRAHRMLTESASEPGGCVICGAPTHNRGLFFPHKPADYGAPPGKGRILVYPFCGEHEMTPEVHERIEGMIFAKLQRYTNALKE